MPRGAMFGQNELSWGVERPRLCMPQNSNAKNALRWTRVNEVNQAAGKGVL